MTELRTIADANISPLRFGLIEDLTDVPRTEDPDSDNPNPKPNKFGLIEDFTDVPRTDPDGDPNPNKSPFIEDFTDVPRTEDDGNPMVEIREVIAADSNSTNSLFGRIDKISGLPNDNITGTPGNDYLVGKHYTEDDIFGGGGADTLKGLDSDDFLFGGTGNDKVYGGGDSDWLEGNSGNDFLVGHANGDGYDYYEVDTLIGGSGADTFSLVIDGPEFEVPYLDGLGEHAYAIIQDFKKADGDAILMVGQKQDYEFVSGYYNYGNDSLKDTKIFYQGDMIAVVSDTMTADLTLSFV
ncbi:calcium-binding protein [Microcoleus sp. B3-D7]|uniref:calcium-binding protein n=1 Tax=Microcoleus sp. B3-D7 TaxID=2818659 RepID=UPI002FD1E8BF